MKILDLVDDVRSGCKSVLTTMTLEEYKKLSFLRLIIMETLMDSEVL